jgi:hypothetical protein
MKISIWKSGVYGFLLLVFTIGCDKRGDVLPNEGWDGSRHAAPDRSRPERDASRMDSDEDESTTVGRRDCSESWDDDRATPDNASPSRTEDADDVRHVSGDSMPIRTEKWTPDAQ